MIPALDARGLLPPGRYKCNTAEVEAVFVDHATFAPSVTRRQVWDDFLALVELVRRKRVKVPAAFVGGSFTGSAMDPSDVDATLLYDASRITSPPTITAIATITAGAKTVAKLKVDAFTIPWFPHGDQTCPRQVKTNPGAATVDSSQGRNA